MASVIRPNISKKNKYWIDKHRYYELKHFCLQYPIWKKELTNIHEFNKSSSIKSYMSNTNLPNDPVCDLVVLKLYYSNKIDLVENIAKKSDKYLSEYILRAVTEDISYTKLKSRLEIPCSRGMYYDRYRRFFWLLDQERD